MKDIELPPLPEPSMFAEYWASDMQTYARAAVEADRAQRVPDGWLLIATDAYEAGFGKGEQAHKTGKDVENPWGDDPGREAWAMGYALGKERAASTPAPAQHQEPPHQERKPMTQEQVGIVCDSAGYLENGMAKTDFINGIRHAERHHGIKE